MIGVNIDWFWYGFCTCILYRQAMRLRTVQWHSASLPHDQMSFSSGSSSYCIDAIEVLVSLANDHSVTGQLVLLSVHTLFHCSIQIFSWWAHALCRALQLTMLTGGFLTNKNVQLVFYINVRKQSLVPIILSISHTLSLSAVTMHPHSLWLWNAVVLSIVMHCNTTCCRHVKPANFAQWLTDLYLVARSECVKLWSVPSFKLTESK